MNSRFLIYALSIFVSTLSCHSNAHKEYRNQKGGLVVEEYFPDDHVKTRIIYNDENKTDYVFTSYYDDGTLMDSARYVNGKIEGKRILYEKNADLLHIEHYSNGILEGVNKAEYGDGTTSYEGYRLNGEKVGEWTFHYPEGNPITYEFYDSTGQLLYFRKYDEEGRTEKTNGNGILNISDAAHIDSTGLAYINALVVNPPLSESIFTVENEKAGNDNVIIGKVKVTTPRIVCPIQIPGSGTYELSIGLTITERSTGEVEQFEKSQNVTITEK